MHKLVILINVPAENDEFDFGWPAFLNHAERMPGLVRESTSRVNFILFGDPDYNLIHELYFETRADLENAMQSEHGQKAGVILQRITHSKFTLLFAEHHEDTADNLRRETETES